MMDIVKVIAGGVATIIIGTVALMIAKSGADRDNIVRVVNEATQSDDFFVSDKIDAATLLGRQASAVNTTVDGYKAYKDRNVLFYVENPKLKLQEADTFSVNFKAANDICRSIFYEMDMTKFHVKDITVNGESIKAIKEYAHTGGRYGISMDCAKNYNAPRDAVYTLKYEFYFK